MSSREIVVTLAAAGARMRSRAARAWVSLVRARRHRGRDGAAALERALALRRLRGRPG